MNAIYLLSLLVLISFISLPQGRQPHRGLSGLRSVMKHHDESSIIAWEISRFIVNDCAFMTAWNLVILHLIKLNILALTHASSFSVYRYRHFSSISVFFFFIFSSVLHVHHNWKKFCLPLLGTYHIVVFINLWMCCAVH